MQSASRFGSFEKWQFTFFWYINTVTRASKSPTPSWRRNQQRQRGPSEPLSCGLQRVQLEDVVIGRRGEEELLLVVGGTVVTRALQAQRPLKIQELTHEVEVGGNVGLFPLDKVVGVVEGQVESLHQVGHRDGDRAADAGQAVDQDAALLRSSLICQEKKGKVALRGRLVESHAKVLYTEVSLRWYNNRFLLTAEEQVRKHRCLQAARHKHPPTTRALHLTRDQT